MEFLSSDVRRRSLIGRNVPLMDLIRFIITFPWNFIRKTSQISFLNLLWNVLHALLELIVLGITRFAHLLGVSHAIRVLTARRILRSAVVVVAIVAHAQRVICSVFVRASGNRVFTLFNSRIFVIKTHTELCSVRRLHALEEVVLDARLGQERHLL